MTDHTSAEAMREALEKIVKLLHSDEGFAPGVLATDEAEKIAIAALSTSQAQGVTITDEMVERAVRAFFGPKHDPMSRYAKRLAADMRAALEAASIPKDSAQGEGWKPIETAPRNKLFWGIITDGVEVSAGWLNIHDGQHWFQPTHWMPLPSTPTDRGNALPADEAEEHIAENRL